MHLFTVKELLDKYKNLHDQYVYVQGHYHAHSLRQDCSKSAISIIIDKDTHFHSSLDYFLKRMNKPNYEGIIRLVGKVGVAMTAVANFGQILKVEIIDEAGKIVEVSKIEINSVPKELRGEI